MQLVRIEQPRSPWPVVELHPRLTVLVDAPATVRHAVRAAARLAAGQVDSPVGLPGRGPTVRDWSVTVQINGVLLDLDDEAAQRLQIGEQPDPVLSLADPGAVERPTDAPVTGSPEAIRAQLRAVSGQLGTLGRRLTEVRSTLDPHAATAVAVAVGRRDALRSRGARHRADDPTQESVAEIRGLLHDERRELETLERLLGADLAPIVSERDRLAQLLVDRDPADPASVELAAQIDQALWTLRDLESRRVSADIRAQEAEQRLVEARDDLAAAQQHHESSAGDRETVRRLEAVREEIFSAERTVGRLGAARKRRLRELRADEAVLLDHLGFDTYSAYVIGLRSVRADAARTAAVAEADARVARVEREIEQLERDTPEPASIAGAAEALDALLRQAAGVLGTDPIRVGPATVDGQPVGRGGLDRWRPISDAELSGEVYDVVSQLRERRLLVGTGEDPRVAACTSELRSLIDAVVDDESLYAPLDTDDARSLLATVDRWLAHVAGLGPRAQRTRERLAQLTRRLDELSEQEQAPDPSLLEAERTLAAAMQRSAAHERAVREDHRIRQELRVLRDRERDLLETLSAAQTKSDRQTPPPYNGRVPSEDAPLPQQPGEWDLLSRLAGSLQVSFVGSTPVVVDGLPGSAELRQQIVSLCERMSDMVQIVVLAAADTPVELARPDDAAVRTV